MPDTFKVSLYIRVSTDKQANEGDSLDEQERELKRFCEFKGYMIHRTHIEPGRSAKDTKRPEYQKLMADIETEKINAVVVKKLDRLSRSLMDFEGFMTVAQTHNVEFISLKENFDTTNAMGKAMLRVALVFAQLEREQTSERVLDVFAYRAQNGLNNGGIRPFGYCSVDTELVPDKKEAKTVQLVFEKFIELKSTLRVAEYINSLGLRNRDNKLWDKNRIDAMLRRPVYAGKTSFKGEIFLGIHQPLVSEKSFAEVQDIFKSRAYYKTTTKIPGILKNLLYCGHCDAPLTPNYSRKKNGTKYYYYRCTHTVSLPTKTPCPYRGYYTQSAVEKCVFAKILEFGTEAMLATLKKSADQRNEKIEREIKVLEDELTGIEAKLETVKIKKEKYLDSLVSNSFTVSERQMINDKIQEFTLEEKQLKATIYRQQFDISSKSALIESIDPFKQAMVTFKVNQAAMSPRELADWLNEHICRIVYRKESVTIEFKLLKAGS